MLSVIIPAHNEEQYIAQTVASLRQQTWKDFELIVVCDGCTDKTFDVVKKQAEKVVVLKERKGPAVAKNEGARIAKGEILVFLDADTLVAPTLLTKIAAETKDGLVGTAKMRPSLPSMKHRCMMGLKNKLLCPWGVTNGILFCTRKTFEERKGFDARLQKMEDGMFVRDAKAKARFVIIDDYVVSSTRRFDRLGYSRVMWYWMKEYLRPSGEEYEVIR